MFFIASKVFWGLASPVTLLLILAFLGILLSLRRPGIGRALTAASLLVLIAAAETPLGLLLVRPLEDRFSTPPADMPPPDGVIILGSAVNGATSAARGQAVFEEGERVIQAVLLAKRYPKARIIYTGGSETFIGRVVAPEAEEARKLMVALGVDPARIILEDKSRNTEENASLTAAIVHPEPSQHWLLVTSGFHMPRSMGVFERTGFNVIAYPVAFWTYGPERDLPWTLSPAKNLRVFEIAIREYIGLVAYWATGRIDRLFPGPRQLDAQAGAPSR